MSFGEIGSGARAQLNLDKPVDVTELNAAGKYSTGSWKTIGQRNAKISILAVLPLEVQLIY